MNNKMKLKLMTDLLMTGLLLFLMPYELVGRMAHEWLGTGMLVLFVMHHSLNRSWIKNLRKGTYTLFRMVQTILAAWVLLTMLGSMVSGILLSRYVFSFLDIRGMASFARKLHMVCAYWGFVGMSLHLGIHWGMLLGMLRKRYGRLFGMKMWAVRVAAVAAAGYGIYVFVRREIGSYMLMQIQFVFFNFEEPLTYFILDYIAVMGFFVFIGHYLCKGLKNMGKQSADTEKK